MKKLLLIVVSLVLLLTACGKKCRCYRYDGNVDEFSLEELDQKETTCAYLEQKDFGQYYSLCEKTIF